MATQTRRVLGLSTSVLVVVDTAVLKSITKIKSFTGEIEIKTLEEGYLGFPTNLFDEVLQGFSGKLEFDHDDPDFFDFCGRLIARSSRQVDFKVNITTSFKYADGSVRRMQLQDVSFGNVPIGIRGRSEYMSSSLDCKTGLIKFAKQ